MCAKLLQSCLTLCDPMHRSPPGSFVHGILQARTLEWVARPSSRESSQPRGWTDVSYLSLLHWKAGSWVPPCSSDGKESACNVGDLGLIPESGRSPRERNGNPLQYSCLENSKDREVWWARVHRVTKSQTWLKRLNTYPQEELSLLIWEFSFLK